MGPGPKSLKMVQSPYAEFNSSPKLPTKGWERESLRGIMNYKFKYVLILNFDFYKKI